MGLFMILAIALNDPCTDGGAADQCTDTLAECRDDAGFKCLCKASHFVHTSGACAARKILSSTPF